MEIRYPVPRVFNNPPITLPSFAHDEVDLGFDIDPEQMPPLPKNPSVTEESF